MRGWTADHDLDEGGPNPIISTGRGALIEATKGTWLAGAAMDHNTLYQYYYNNAKNVCSIFQQSETPYWQGRGNDMAPQPWAANLQASDPQFKNCAPDIQYAVWRGFKKSAVVRMFFCTVGAFGSLVTGADANAKVVTVRKMVLISRAPRGRICMAQMCTILAPSLE
jgi:hypothetical protein